MAKAHLENAGGVSWPSFAALRVGQRARRFRAALLGLASILTLLACGRFDDAIQVPSGDLGEIPEPLQTAFKCTEVDAHTCELGRYLSCKRVDEFVELVTEDCARKGLSCDAQVGCVSCLPGERRCQTCEGGDSDCDPLRIEVCNARGTAFEPAELCSWEDGLSCSDGACANLCQEEARNRSYVGCSFFAVDLDNVAIDALNDAASQQYAVAVANPHARPIRVQVEHNTARYGQPAQVEVVQERTVPPNFLEVFELPQREVDGASQTGFNDGTHSALSPNAYRVVSSHPVTAYQFNPLDNVDVFSNDASLLLPTPALGLEYSAIGWPQTIADSDDPRLDFDPLSDDEDLRAFLTVVGAFEDTTVEVNLGQKVVRVLGAEGIPESGPGDVIKVKLGPFEVLNLETAGPNADFTGTKVKASRVVAVFTGSEASDVPMFADLSTRQCCADHLEEQLFPDRTLGASFVVTHMPPRSKSLNASAAPGTSVGAAEVVEKEWVRVLAAGSSETTVRTTLEAPYAEFVLPPRGDATIPADRDFLISATGPLAVLQALPSQDVTGIPRQYPGGDPAIVMVPPREQYRSEYIFLTPDKYAYDYVTIAARAGTEVRLDDRDVALDPACDMATLSGGAVFADYDAVIFRCQLSFPEVVAGPDPVILPGQQDDGVHRVRATAPVGLVVYGFDRYVSYAYTGGLNLEALF